MDHRLSHMPLTKFLPNSIRRRASVRTLVAGLFLAALSTLPVELRAQEMRDSLGKQLGPVASAIVRSNETAEKQFNLLARVELRPDEIVEFYEPSPGMVVISGAGTSASMAAPNKMPQSPAEVWRRAASGREMPAALREAIERGEKRKQIRYEDNPRNPGKWGGGSPARDYTRSAGYCDAAYHHEYGGCGSGYDFMVCLNNWWDGAFAYHHEAQFTWTHVCPATGRVTLRVRSNEIDGGLWTVDQHHIRYFHYDQPSCSSPFDDCPFMRADVEQATGVRFHFEFLVFAE